jgi:protein lysine acetyltransferase
MTSSPTPRQLRSLDLFTDCRDEDLVRVASLLTSVTVAHGGVMMHEGSAGDELMILGNGIAGVSKADVDGRRHVGIVPGGSVVGELALLEQTPRSATVTALVPLTVYVCSRHQLDELLLVPGVGRRVADIAARRLAANRASVALEVPAMLADGTRLLLRPIRPADKAKLAEGMRRLSPESRRRRFFTAKERLSDLSLTYLTELDYVSHFAWVAVTPGAGNDGQQIVGVARYIRLPAEPDAAEVALTVLDDYQGRGLGSLLFDALAVAAAVNGIERFVALVLRDNLPMCAMLRRAGGQLDADEPGVLRSVTDVGTVHPRLEQSCDLTRLRATVMISAGRPAVAGEAAGEAAGRSWRCPTRKATTMSASKAAATMPSSQK